MNKWNRLESLIRWTGMSVNAFALNIGLKRAENLYQIKKGNNGISIDLAELIVRKYPLVNKIWLLTGEGEMFRQEGFPELVPLPCHEILVPDMESVKPVSSIAVPAFKDCDFLVHWNGNSMEPQIPGGSWVALKRSDTDNILYGTAYMLITETFVTLRDIRSVPGSEEKIRLVPKNNSGYDDIVISKDQVKAIYMVKGIVHLF